MKALAIFLVLLVVVGVFFLIARPRARNRRGDDSAGDAGSAACHGSRDASPGHEAGGSGDCGGDGGGGGD
jgi:hypothetical protein